MNMSIKKLPTIPESIVGVEPLARQTFRPPAGRTVCIIWKDEVFSSFFAFFGRIQQCILYQYNRR